MGHFYKYIFTEIIQTVVVYAYFQHIPTLTST